MIEVGSDFSGVGAFDQALIRLKIPYKTVYSCDMDKYARKTFIHNYGEPKYYPENVYDRKIPENSLDIYMTSPPCQAFSLAGKRKGEDDDRGVLFYNSHEFIQKNKPRYFIFENVKGLLSDDGGKTFERWCQYLGGKSINGNYNLFPLKEAAPYHIYYKVLNAKNYGVPQNRERIFIIGIRDEEDNTFRFPKEERLTKRLKDVLEDDVNEKYYLSDRILKNIIRYSRAKGEVANVNKGRQSGGVWSEDSDEMSCLSASDYKMPKCVEIKSATKKRYEEADEGVMIGAMRGRNPENPKRRESGLPTEQQLELNENGTSNALTTVQKDNLVVTNRIRRLSPRECFRLMDFPDTFDFSVVSDTQAYKQAGNSIVVSVLEKIINNLKL